MLRHLFVKYFSNLPGYQCSASFRHAFNPNQFRTYKLSIWIPIHPTRFSHSLQLILANCDKNVEIISNLGGKEPSPWTRARGSIHGCGSILEAWTTPILCSLLTHARIGLIHAQNSKIRTLAYSSKPWPVAQTCQIRTLADPNFIC